MSKETIIDIACFAISAAFAACFVYGAIALPMATWELLTEGK
jgi:hypothetical protein